MADKQPGTAKDALHLQLEDVRVCVYIAVDPVGPHQTAQRLRIKFFHAAPGLFLGQQLFVQGNYATGQVVVVATFKAGILHHAEQGLLVGIVTPYSSPAARHGQPVVPAVRFRAATGRPKASPSLT